MHKIQYFYNIGTHNKLGQRDDIKNIHYLFKGTIPVIRIFVFKHTKKFVDYIFKTHKNN